jgi:DNA-directed RNA polymerase specialized sigma24 family protein
MPRSDPELIRDSRDGNATAWHEFVDRYAPLVYTIACRFVPSRADAIFQSVFTLAYRELASLSNQPRLITWIITTTYRECQRSGQDTVTSSDRDTSSIDSPALSSEEISRWEHFHRVHQAFNMLCPRCQERLKARLFGAPVSGYLDHDVVDTHRAAVEGKLDPTVINCLKEIEAILADIGIDGDPQAVKVERLS